MGANLRHAGCRWTSDATRGNGGELMPVHKRKYQSGSTNWYFKFQPPGAMRGTSTIRGFGFATKGEAQTAERNRRTEEEQKYELAKAAAIVGQVPQTLAMLLAEFFRQHADQKLAPKTRERYHEQAVCLAP